MAHQGGESNTAGEVEVGVRLGFSVKLRGQGGLMETGICVKMEENEGAHQVEPQENIPKSQKSKCQCPEVRAFYTHGTVK